MLRGRTVWPLEQFDVAISGDICFKSGPLINPRVFAPRWGGIQRIRT